MCQSARVGIVRHIYLHKSRPLGPRAPLITKISNYILVTETGTSSLREILRITICTEFIYYVKCTLHLLGVGETITILLNLIYIHLLNKIEKLTTNTNLSYKMEIF